MSGDTLVNFAAALRVKRDAALKTFAETPKARAQLALDDARDFVVLARKSGARAFVCISDVAPDHRADLSVGLRMAAVAIEITT